MSNDDRQFPDWQQVYKDGAVEQLPWYNPDLDADLARALERLGIASGKVLDLGTGPGTQALHLAQRGFDVTGSDLSQGAVAYAEQLAAERGLSIRFVLDDILNSTIAGPFDVVFDRGCFHVLPPERRADYVAAVRRLVAPDGHLFVKCFSSLQPGDVGPHRFTPEMIHEIFGGSFEVSSVDQTVYQGQRDPFPLALFCVLRPRPAANG
ncbi:SAM-dependent methyltransferase [Chondromyces crocatus]|uniref:Methyltransferase domain-containing protein n=1 Tax=Chondromyces crocatus TaxID=52 RepID=A0A0K1EGF8_CHOCO|nr:class I SAM-dependent methyltransferase [Chondromyces crocatus]AKT39663.1 uncharacterized protein CMC5_038120 [Chondromyces crocatus]